MTPEFADRTRQSHQDSLRASELVYGVGGFRESPPDPSKLPPRLRRLLERYRIVETYADPGTGFKGIALEELNGSGRRIYAVAGFELRKLDVSDASAILRFAKPQLGGVRAKDFLEDAIRHARRKGDIHITGQSMGGLLAQTLSYLAQRQLDDRPKGRVSLTTWAAVGGRELTDHVLKEKGEAFDPEIMRKVNATGFYVDGDPLTRIGTHMEPTRAIPRPEGMSPFSGHFIEKGLIPAIEAAPRGLDSATPKTPERDEETTKSFKRNLDGDSSVLDIPVPPLRDILGIGDTDREDPADDAPSESRGMLGEDMLIDPRNLSFENKERVRAELGFHAEEAAGDPRKQAKLAKCLGDCFVREPGFDGLPGSLPEQLGGIAATMNPDTALAVLRRAVPEAAQTEPPRRRNQAQQRRRQAGAAPLDESGRAAVRQAVLRLGPGQVQADIARGAARKAVERIGGDKMMAKQLPGVLGAAFAPMGGGDKPMRAAAVAANAINEGADASERADPENAAGRESATAIERAIQVAGPEKFLETFDENLVFSPRRGNRRRAGRNLFGV